MAQDELLLEVAHHEEVADMPVDAHLSRRGLARLSLRYPELTAELRSQTGTNEEFELLCSAFEEACDALDAWRRSGASGHEVREAEYAAIVSELESELVELCRKPKN